MARLLYYRCRGDDVKALQYWLNYISATQRQSYLAALPLTGEFDGKTFRRVLEFQWFTGMETKDGIVGPKTRLEIAKSADLSLREDGSLPLVPGSADGKEVEHLSNRRNRS
jgi:peptidoglycan hydrolase-like protein with peptidoglycan-binding domain